jgi:hypothetical protein
MRSPLQNELMIRFKSLKAHPASDELSVRRRAAGNATSVVPLLSLDQFVDPFKSYHGIHMGSTRVCARWENGRAFKIKRQVSLYLQFSAWE